MKICKFLGILNDIIDRLNYCVYNNASKITLEWDENKRAINIRKHERRKCYDNN